MFVLIPGFIPPVKFWPVGTDPLFGSISPVTYIQSKTANRRYTYTLSVVAKLINDIENQLGTLLFCNFYCKCDQGYC